jgi:hypothetical protein
MATIRGTGLEADGVLQLLLWLGSSPEQFVAGAVGADADRWRLARPEPRFILRVDTRAMHAALDRVRRERAMSWQRLADELGVASAAWLTGLARGGRTTIHLLTIVAGWLGVPCATFTRASPG